jgi:hypothetical protein
METADSSSADDGRPQYFIRNSDSSATRGDDSSDDSSFDSSGAGAESAGDSPQGKSDVVQPRQDGGFDPTRGRVAQNERDRERDEETGRECGAVEGPSGVSTRTTKAKVRWKARTRLRISKPWGDVVEAQCQQRTRSWICHSRV